MSYIRILQVLTEEGRFESGGFLAKIEFCWGTRRRRFNHDRAIVLLEHLENSIKKKELQDLANAFNLPMFVFEKYNYSLLEHFVAFLNFVENWTILKNCSVEHK